MVVPNDLRRQQTLKLMEQKDRIERKIADFGRILEMNKNVGMTESLVDENDFPRSDIDVVQVRHARHQIICLQNDLKELMKLIQKGIEDIHAEASSTPQTVEGVGAFIYTPGEPKLSKGFVSVNFVSPGSPADDACICVGDEIVEFGSIHAANFNDLTSIAEVVKHRENQNVLVKLKRGTELIETYLKPRKWAGRGLLGCNIVILPNENVER